MGEIAWRIVDRYVNPIEANIVRGRLEVEGIPAVLGNEQLVTQDWLLSVATGGVVVQVPAEMIEDAKAIIAGIDRGEFDEPGETCAECGTTLSLGKASPTRGAALLSATFLGLPLPFRGPNYTCPVCEG